MQNDMEGDGVKSVDFLTCGDVLVRVTNQQPGLKKTEQGLLSLHSNFFLLLSTTAQTDSATSTVAAGDRFLPVLVGINEIDCAQGAMEGKERVPVLFAWSQMWVSAPGPFSSQTRERSRLPKGEDATVR